MVACGSFGFTNSPAGLLALLCPLSAPSRRRQSAAVTPKVAQASPWCRWTPV